MAAVWHLVHEHNTARAGSDENARVGVEVDRKRLRMLIYRPVVV